MMVNIDQEKITAFCCRWGVSELALFGSALRGDFSSTSDVDELVSFKPDTRRMRCPTCWACSENRREKGGVFNHTVLYVV